MAVSDGQKCKASVLNAAFADKNFQTIPAGSQFTIVNNQAAPANVTSLIFDKVTMRSQVIKWQVYRKSTGGGAMTRVQVGRAFVWYDDTNIFLTQEGMSSVDAGVVLDVDATSGQVTYVSDNQTGTYAAGTSVLTYEIEQTMRL